MANSFKLGSPKVDSQSPMECCYYAMAVLARFSELGHKTNYLVLPDIVAQYESRFWLYSPQETSDI